MNKGLRHGTFPPRLGRYHLPLTGMLMSYDFADYRTANGLSFETGGLAPNGQTYATGSYDAIKDKSPYNHQGQFNTVGVLYKHYGGEISLAAGSVGSFRFDNVSSLRLQPPFTLSTVFALHNIDAVFGAYVFANYNFAVQNFGFGLNISSVGVLRFSIRVVGADVSVTFTLPNVTQFYHVIVTFANNYLCLYCNGVLVDRKLVTARAEYTATMYPTIGAVRYDPGTTSGNFAGTINNLHVWERELKAHERNGLWNKYKSYWNIKSL